MAYFEQRWIIDPDPHSGYWVWDTFNDCTYGNRIAKTEAKRIAAELNEWWNNR